MPDVSYATVKKPSRSLLTNNSHLWRCSGSLRIDDTIIWLVSSSIRGSDSKMSRARFLVSSEITLAAS